MSGTRKAPATGASAAPTGWAQNLAAPRLRRRAEDALREQTPEQLASLPPDEARQALQELRVHQIELEMQNEELRRARQELEVSRERYFELYELAPAGYCSISEAGLILETNLALATLLVEARAAIVGRRFSAFVLAQDQDLYYLQRKRLLESGGPQSCELRLARREGGECWVSMVSTTAEDAAGALVVRVVLVDISARKQVEIALERIRKEQQAILDSEVVGIFKSKDRKILWCNRTFERMLGREAGKLLGKSKRVIFPDAADYTLFGDAAYPAIGRVGVFRAEIRYLRGDGSVGWADITGAKLYTDREETIWSFVDISERKRAELELEQTSARVSALSRRLIEVQELERVALARELHDEIGQALTAVRLHLKVLEREDAQGKHRESLDRALGVVERAIGQVRGLSLRLRPPVLDDLGLLPALRWLVLQQSWNRGLRIEIEAVPEGVAEGVSVPAGVTEAAYRIAQEALTNVLRHAHAGRATIRVEQNADRLAVLIRDDGRGFDPAEVRSLGGFGLLGMQERVKLAGGTLVVSSERGRGTQVRAEFGLGT